MDLYLDSVNFEEIEQAFELGFLTGLTTTPTFMHRHGITDVDGAIVKLSKMVPELQVEALGNTHDEIVAEVDRLLGLPLDLEPVFKVPISQEGVRACSTLTKRGHRVNVHLIYTLNQAYIAMAAGAAFVCPLAGRLQDQGHDSNALFEQCVNVVEKYNYPTKIMFSSVRHPEHVRQALIAGAHVCTMPWGVMRTLSQNALTTVGTNQFLEHTRLMTVRVNEVIREQNPMCRAGDKVTDALLKMTESRLGAVTLVDDSGDLLGVFTDGDLRRNLQSHGSDITNKSLGDLGFSENPITIESDALLYDAMSRFEESQVDTIVVVENGKPVGILDIQDVVSKDLFGT
ncbi:MAG: CBS domain-containing protein [Proteobacteria bacterium]|nr:CBS domain-containing protein [Pseudomonadota bacterium]